MDLILLPMLMRSLNGRGFEGFEEGTSVPTVRLREKVGFFLAACEARLDAINGIRVQVLGFDQLRRRPIQGCPQPHSSWDERSAQRRNLIISSKVGATASHAGPRRLDLQSNAWSTQQASATGPPCRSSPLVCPAAMMDRTSLPIRSAYDRVIGQLPRTAAGPSIHAACCRAPADSGELQLSSTRPPNAAGASRRRELHVLPPPIPVRTDLSNRFLDLLT